MRQVPELHLAPGALPRMRLSLRRGQPHRKALEHWGALVTWAAALSAPCAAPKKESVSSLDPVNAARVP
jgi:hypothetical protein